MRLRLPAIGLAAIGILTLATGASAEVYRIDRAHSGVNFKVKHFFTMVPGRFTQFDGTIDFDPANVEKASVEVTIDANSVTTDHPKRDPHLRSPDFFWVEKHPTITFKSTKVTKKSDTELDVLGDLTIRGITKPVTLNVEVLGVAPDMTGFFATTKINRLDYDVRWNNTLDDGRVVLGDDFMIEIPIEAKVNKEG
jgi:polyisoprenoid-binding protein YceI